MMVDILWLVLFIACMRIHGNNIFLRGIGNYHEISDCRSFIRLSRMPGTHLGLWLRILLIVLMRIRNFVRFE